MHLTIIGTGYVGLVSGACLATSGHRVTCVDINPKKIAMLSKGDVPFFETTLSDLVRRTLGSTLHFSETLVQSDAFFICVGTPYTQNGTDMSQYDDALHVLERTIKKMQPKSPPLVINKSTVPVGTARKVQAMLKNRAIMVSCPEFLREGSAVDDFFHPDRLIFGISETTQRTVEALREIHRGIKARCTIVTSWETAELIKYAANAFLATKISFINEIANIAERVGADIDIVADAIGKDSRIGPHFLRPGIGYGGSCFPKDAHTLAHIGDMHGYDFTLLKGTIEVNRKQREMYIAKILSVLGKNARGKKVVVIGLAFKNNTDDVRESPSIYIIEKLTGHGIAVAAYYPQANRNAAAYFKNKTTNLIFLDDPYTAAVGADVLYIGTEWEEFSHLDWGKIRASMRHASIIDGKNVLDPRMIRDAGFSYYGVGRLMH